MTASDAALHLGICPARISEFIKHAVISPERDQGNRQGNPTVPAYRFTEEVLRELRIAVDLRDWRIPLKRVRHILQVLREAQEPWREGGYMLVCTFAGQVECYLEKESDVAEVVCRTSRAVLVYPLEAR